MTKMLTTDDVRKLTGADGAFFSVGFHKRPKPLGKRAIARGETQPTEGEYREFVCRFGVKKDLKGGVAAYNAKEKNLLVVWVPKPGLNLKDQEALADEKNGDYRSIPCENVRLVKARGKTWAADGGSLVEQTDAD